ncbi:MAG: hypothetical protein FD138_3717 [Planctomycetota bacterium]|nr:MAG: hypothetical protein FD138_3717 [Planctomycetota bacterium]
MFELRRRLHFPLEPPDRVRCLDCIRREHLERDHSLHSLMLGLEHHPHAPLPQLVEDQVIAECQRRSLALINRLSLPSRQPFLLHQLASQLLAVARPIFDRHRGDPIAQLVLGHHAGRRQSLSELLDRQWHEELQLDALATLRILANEACSMASRLLAEIGRDIAFR